MGTLLLLLVTFILPSHLTILDNYSVVRFESADFPGWFIGFDENELTTISSSSLLLINTFPNYKTTWNVVKDLCDVSKYGFQASSYPDYYIKINGDTLVVSKFASLSEFKTSNCFSIESVTGQPNTLTLLYGGRTVCSNKRKEIRLYCSSELLTKNWYLRYNGLQETKGNCQKANKQWSEWSLWSPCSTSCGTKGIKTRQRKCIGIVPNYGGANNNCLVEVDVQEKACNVKSCPKGIDYYKNEFWKCFFFPPVHGQWSTWISQTSCGSSCDGGLKYATRMCDSPVPKLCGSMCGEESFNAEICPVHGQWSKWSPWDTCTVTCGSGGTKTRTRTCTNPTPKYGGSNCVGLPTETFINCNNINCPINGGWSDWSSLSSCSVTCGGGTQSRTRTCTNPTPQYSGSSCAGSSTGTLNCNINTCPLCASGWTEKFSRCYYHSGSDTRTWQNAQSYCQSKGGNLVSIESSDENDFVFGLTTSSTHTFLGYSDLQSEGTFKWIDGTTTPYTNWAGGEPNDYGDNEDCMLYLDDNTKTWNDGGCTDSFRFICKASKSNSLSI